jgi:MoaA/NifB/PqqE/SkfB family radical SAM enzyme
MKEQARHLRWLEISADYRCNNRCVGCHSVNDDGPGMSSREIAAHLVRARDRGATKLWLGGGEPTLRRDGLAAAKRARELGYTTVLLQTNGMLLAYPEVARRWVEAGVTEVTFALKGARAATHDRLTRTPGCHELLLQGIAAMAEHGLPLSGDILAYASNVQEIPEMVGLYAGLGLRRFSVWSLSAVDQGDRDLSAQVPRLSDVARAVTAAMDAHPTLEIVSLHTPPCVVPGSHHRCLFHAAELGLLVVNPGGHSFMLEESAIEGGTFLPRCAGCSHRATCGGLRADYLAIHGDSEIEPH